MSDAAELAAALAEAKAATAAARTATAAAEAATARAELMMREHAAPARARSSLDLGEMRPMTSEQSHRARALPRRIFILRHGESEVRRSVADIAARLRVLTCVRRATWTRRCTAAWPTRRSG